ncbi:hypothetical protein SPRG_04374 [Saprolegnia parasitica CBS 223.65]|uniref:Uncharacterized protein n=1 Tax=Saprolegnia parasitica (strain CBS 223.65) TaxID=695850 RepID=A0A067CVA6_SAPPC|nr:hypothetical protein SPRG_04374 [Saprolegnia parasitica CBS 223.65]KDO30471.1 hypothetical protein SPRG_04374 [Saprolegnia parasitica CBS 223.65]|eukprot:XP_012198693.1 hypothetical protein SPRG_04374 [Saprolegnia parasitica CBS 223.65]
MDLDRDEMLDDMSLSSDDEMFEDMINEMTAPTPAPRAVATVRPAAPARTQMAPIAPRGAAPMPDLSKMMAQMMPMMSQMFGGNAGMQPNRRVMRAMEDVVADHVPADEVASWVETIQRDEARQQAARTAKPRTNLSRSYRTKDTKLPSDHLQAATLMQELLLDAVRSAKVTPSATWEKNQLRVHTELRERGIDAIYAKELQASLRRHVQGDADADPARFPVMHATLLT